MDLSSTHPQFHSCWNFSFLEWLECFETFQGLFYLSSFSAILLGDVIPLKNERFTKSFIPWFWQSNQPRATRGKYTYAREQARVHAHMKTPRINNAKVTLIHTHTHTHTHIHTHAQHTKSTCISAHTYTNVVRGFVSTVSEITWGFCTYRYQKYFHPHYLVHSIILRGYLED